MNERNEDEKKIAMIAEQVRQETSSDANEESPEMITGCCYITTTTGYRTCFDWAGLDAEACKKIGDQSGSAYQFVPGDRCHL